MAGLQARLTGLHVLMAIARLGENTDIMSVVNILHKRVDPNAAPGGIYLKVDYLVKKGLVKEVYGMPPLRPTVTQRGRWRRRVVSLTPAGKKHIHDELTKIRRLLRRRDPHDRIES